MAVIKINENALNVVKDQLVTIKKDLNSSLSNIANEAMKNAALNIFNPSIYLAGLEEDQPPIRDYRSSARNYIHYAKQIASKANELSSIKNEIDEISLTINSVLKTVEEFQNLEIDLPDLVLENESFNFTLNKDSLKIVKEVEVPIEKIHEEKKNEIARQELNDFITNTYNSSLDVGTDVSNEIEMADILKESFEINNNQIPFVENIANGTGAPIVGNSAGSSLAFGSTLVGSVGLNMILGDNGDFNRADSILPRLSKKAKTKKNKKAVLSTGGSFSETMSFIGTDQEAPIKIETTKKRKYVKKKMDDIEKNTKDKEDNSNIIIEEKEDDIVINSSGAIIAPEVEKINLGEENIQSTNELYSSIPSEVIKEENKEVISVQDEKEEIVREDDSLKASGMEKIEIDTEKSLEDNEEVEDKTVIISQEEFLKQNKKENVVDTEIVELSIENEEKAIEEDATILPDNQLYKTIVTNEINNSVVNNIQTLNNDNDVTSISSNNENKTLIDLSDLEKKSDKIIKIVSLIVMILGIILSIVLFINDSLDFLSMILLVVAIVLLYLISRELHKGIIKGRNTTNLERSPIKVNSTLEDFEK